MPVILDAILEGHLTTELRIQNRNEDTRMKMSGNNSQERFVHQICIRTCAGRTFLGRQLKHDLCHPIGNLPHLSQACLEPYTWCDVQSET
jgi:hypothetical protein